MLSGHSHGGQVNIPFIPAINQKAISSTNLAKNYVSGMYELNSKDKNIRKYRNRNYTCFWSVGVVPEISIFHYLFIIIGIDKATLLIVNSVLKEIHSLI